MSFADPARYAGTSTASRTKTSGHGSCTTTETTTPTLGSATEYDDDEETQSDVVGVLRLRGAPTGRRVKWVNDTIDNEGLGRKKSKICCIYHKPRAFDESSSSSSSCSSSDDDNAKPSNPPRIPHLPRKLSDDDDEGIDGKGKGKGKGRENDENGGHRRRRRRHLDADGFPIVRKNTRSTRNGVAGHSSESSESDGGLGDGSARPLRQKRRHHLAHNHAHPWTSDCEADDGSSNRHRHRRPSHSHPDHPADIEYAKDKSLGVKSGDGKVVSPRAVNGKQSKVKPNKYEMQVGGG